MTAISQRKALAYKRRAEELETILREQKNRWRREFSPGWINIETLTLAPESYAKISTARLLGHAVILTCDTDYRVRFYAERQQA